MEQTFRSRVWRLGDNIDTDIIIMTKYLAKASLQEMVPHLFEPLRPDLAAQLRPGDAIVAGENFGCGSSREMAASVLKTAGIRCIIAKSFAKIFFRNAINNGLLLIECRDLYDRCREGDTVEVEVGRQLTCNGTAYPIPALSREVLDILRYGGLVPRMRALDKSALAAPAPRDTLRDTHRPGHTLAEQLLLHNTGAEDLRPGDVVTVRVDEAVLHDIYAPYIFQQFRDMGFDRVFDPERVSVMVDHLYPTCLDDDPRCFRYSRRFQDEYGVKRLYVADGISHQLALEEHLAAPGRIIFGTDSHTTTYGAVGAFATGVGYTEMASIIGSGQLWIRVPSAIKVVVNGTLPKGVFPKDIILRVLGDLTAAGAIYKSLEFTGSAIRRLSVSGRAAIANMAVECGAKAALFAPDEKTAAFCGVDLTDCDWLRFDEDAPYERVLTYEADTFTPYLSCPYGVDNVHPIRDVAGTPVDQVFIGSCTNGRLEDLAAAAKVLEGRSIAPYVRLIVTPASKAVYREAARLGYLKTLVQAGAMVTHPFCGLCQGRSGGLVSGDQVVIGTHNRNFIGRMGSPAARTYLASPAVAAASALEGRIADPAPYL
ncbi:aconitase/3-isopropylmalate dehydratase large subunit family protein [uncultured Oscillibacter sp.]|uniref:aconitase/3-isopropylmalate dehydratase large subunit family protein n=1 Tax=uncultured Oscillibacter sp. TaxID=876091 RepID=UPI001FA3BC96|nr:3-isopropylmalate dehydratase large subunit [Candidatus Oscillibacter avistercoris]